MKMISKIAVLIALFVAGRSALAQEFGPWSGPLNLGAPVNSACSDQQPGLSKDGLSLIFASSRPFDHQPTSTSDCLSALHLWISQRDSLDSPWQSPQPLTMLNSAYQDNAPNLTPDGHWLFFFSTRAGGCDGSGFFELWAAHRQNKRDDFGWEAPMNLGCTLNIAGANEAGPNFWEDDATGSLYLYFVRDLLPVPADPNSDPTGNLTDIYVSTCTVDLDTCNRLELWEPAVIVPELNSPVRDSRNAIRQRDGLEMFVSSNRPGTIGGFDLWVSTRTSAQDLWSIPININQDNLNKGGDLVVNTTANEGAPAISWDGQTLIFYSNRAGGYGGNDLYMSTRQKLTGPQQ
jgi:WD40 repeat protein